MHAHLRPHKSRIGPPGWVFFQTMRAQKRHPIRDSQRPAVGLPTARRAGAPVSGGAKTGASRPFPWRRPAPARRPRPPPWPGSTSPAQRPLFARRRFRHRRGRHGVLRGGVAAGLNSTQARRPPRRVPDLVEAPARRDREYVLAAPPLHQSTNAPEAPLREARSTMSRRIETVTRPSCCWTRNGTSARGQDDAHDLADTNVSTASFGAATLPRSSTRETSRDSLRRPRSGARMRGTASRQQPSPPPQAPGPRAAAGRPGSRRGSSCGRGSACGLDRSARARRWRPPPYFPQNQLSPPDEKRYAKFKLVIAGLIAALLVILAALGVGIYYFVSWLF